MARFGRCAGSTMAAQVDADGRVQCENLGLVRPCRRRCSLVGPSYLQK